MPIRKWANPRGCIDSSSEHFGRFFGFRPAGVDAVDRCKPPFALVPKGEVASALSQTVDGKIIFNRLLVLGGDHLQGEMPRILAQQPSAGVRGEPWRGDHDVTRRS